MTRTPTSRSPRQRGFKSRIRVGGWLPGSLTLGNVLAGYASILLASQGRFFVAGALIFAAAIFDGLDGRVARMTGTTSEFGEQLDSLADAISFAVAPSVLAFHMGLAELGRAGWGVCFLFAACGVIRLARFNASSSEHNDFVGVPSPTAAATVACPAIVLEEAVFPPWALPVYAVVVAGIGLLMVSTVRYRSPKNLRFGPRPYRWLAVWAAILAGLIIRYEWVVPGLIALYLLSPVFLRRRRAVRASAEHLGPPGQAAG